MKKKFAIIFIAVLLSFGAMFLCLKFFQVKEGNKVENQTETYVGETTQMDELEKTETYNTEENSEQSMDAQDKDSSDVQTEQLTEVLDNDAEIPENWGE